MEAKIIRKHKKLIVAALTFVVFLALFRLGDFITHMTLGSLDYVRTGIVGYLLMSFGAFLATLVPSGKFYKSLIVWAVILFAILYFTTPEFTEKLTLLSRGKFVIFEGYVQYFGTYALALFLSLRIYGRFLSRVGRGLEDLSGKQ